MFFLRLLCEPLFAQRLRVILPPAFAPSIFQLSTFLSPAASLPQYRALVRKSNTSWPVHSTAAGGFFGAPTCPSCSVRHGRSWDHRIAAEPRALSPLSMADFSVAPSSRNRFGSLVSTPDLSSANTRVKCCRINSCGQGHTQVVSKEPFKPTKNEYLRKLAP
jgi:hypothetical protein